MSRLLDRLNTLQQQKEKFVANSLKTLGADVAGLQDKLLQLLLRDYVSRFEYDSKGNLVNSPKNYRTAAQIDRIFDTFNTKFQQGVLKGFANRLLKLTTISEEYYGAMGVKRGALDKIVKGGKLVQARLGVKVAGNSLTVLEGGYLHRLGRNEQSRQVLANYTLNSIANRTPLLEFTRGFGGYVHGIGGVEANGALQKYYRQFAFDTFNQVDAITNKHIADNLNLKYFIYTGSIIKTSRPFCRKRAGKVFTVAETRKWKNDADLIEPATRASYQPLIERGRYNCRHFIQYISKVIAFELRPELKRAA